MDNNQALEKNQASAPEPGEQEGVTGQESPPGEGEEQQIASPLEPLDERGVPYKNRVAELERKNLEAQTKLKAYEDIVKSQSQHKTVAPERDIDAELLELASKDGPAFLKKLRQTVMEEVNSKVDKTLRQQSEQRITAQYPDIMDMNSELSQEIRKEADLMRSLGFEPLNSPIGLEAIVSNVAKRMPKNGNTPAKVSTPQQTQPGNQFFSAAKPPAKQKGPDKQLSDAQMQLARVFGLKEANVKRLNERYARGDFDIGGGK
jgi:hypothetical protein